MLCNSLKRVAHVVEATGFLSLSDWSFPVYCNYTVLNASLNKTGNRNAVMCVSCGLCLYHWKKTNNPVREHSTLIHRCPYSTLFRHWMFKTCMHVCFSYYVCVCVLEIEMWKTGFVYYSFMYIDPSGILEHGKASCSSANKPQVENYIGDTSVYGFVLRNLICMHERYTSKMY